MIWYYQFALLANYLLPWSAKFPNEYATAPRVGFNAANAWLQCLAVIPIRLAIFNAVSTPLSNNDDPISNNVDPLLKVDCTKPSCVNKVLTPEQLY